MCLQFCLHRGEDVQIHKLVREANHLTYVLDLALRSHTSQDRRERRVTWHLSREDVLVLNMDGSSMGNPGPASSNKGWRMDGGLLWIDWGRGQLVSGVVALMQGLAIAWEAEARRLVCYSDSAMVLELVGGQVNTTHRYVAWICGVREMLRRDWQVELRHTLREGNHAADVLAKLGAQQRERIYRLRSPPAELTVWHSADARRIAHFRV